LQETRRLQKLLARHGHDVGEIDGIIGELTRQAIRKAQIKYRLPADSYPSDELIARLRSDS
jgi:peptidoglycan hydrolase-like protein with peptidoglycan-binding domain